MDDGHFPPTKSSWSRCNQYSANLVCSDSPNLRSLLNKLLVCFSMRFKMNAMLLSGNGLIAKEGPLVVILYILRSTIAFHIHTLYITTFTEHQLEG